MHHLVAVRSWTRRDFKKLVVELEPLTPREVEAATRAGRIANTLLQRYGHRGAFDLKLGSGNRAHRSATRSLRRLLARRRFPGISDVFAGTAKGPIGVASAHTGNSNVFWHLEEHLSEPWSRKNCPYEFHKSENVSKLLECRVPRDQSPSVHWRP
jgi:hypothetical protein